MKSFHLYSFVFIMVLAIFTVVSVQGILSVKATGDKAIVDIERGCQEISIDMDKAMLKMDSSVNKINKTIDSHMQEIK